jgi:hypothetical protein
MPCPYDLDGKMPARAMQMFKPSGRAQRASRSTPAVHLALRRPKLSPVLAQVVHRLEHTDMGDLEMFLGPIGTDAEATIYEAVFA